MPRKGGDPFTCPNCGTRASSPIRTWTLVSPIPDKHGRITITVMGAFVCESCGKTWSSPIEKLKSGGEAGGVERGGIERSEPQTIIIDLEELKKER